MEKKTMQTIHWFPGHMQKARRQMEEQLKLVDIVVELRDARIPQASFNPLLDELSAHKKKLIILNKADLSDEKENRLWKEMFEKEIPCLLVDSISDNLSKKLVNEIKEICKDKIERAKARGIRKKVIRAMIVGIPNVGKSTLINNVVKKKVAKTENRPGVTRSLQWIRLNEDVELLDTPGVLWPKLDDQEAAVKLAVLGSINDDILDKEELASYALDYLKQEYPGVLTKRYEISEEGDLLSAAAKKKLWLTANGEPDLKKAAEAVLKDVRDNRFGRISYEKCPAGE